MANTFQHIDTDGIRVATHNSITPSVSIAIKTPSSFSVTPKTITIGSETFELEQLGLLLKLLLKEHPELQI